MSGALTSELGRVGVEREERDSVPVDGIGEGVELVSGAPASELGRVGVEREERDSQIVCHSVPLDEIDPALGPDI